VKRVAVVRGAIFISRVGKGRGEFTALNVKVVSSTPPDKCAGGEVEASEVEKMR
jgi:hypothetical protein